jgi:hypothetical protein
MVMNEAADLDCITTTDQAPATAGCTLCAVNDKPHQHPMAISSKRSGWHIIFVV